MTVRGLRCVLVGEAALARGTFALVRLEIPRLGALRHLREHEDRDVVLAVCGHQIVRRGYMPDR
eukprot:6191970-Pleurochrysis_carterae.AAC.2